MIYIDAMYVEDIMRIYFDDLLKGYYDVCNPRIKGFLYVQEACESGVLCFFVENHKGPQMCIAHKHMHLYIYIYIYIYI